MLEAQGVAPAEQQSALHFIFSSLSVIPRGKERKKKKKNSASHGCLFLLKTPQGKWEAREGVWSKIKLGAFCDFRATKLSSVRGWECRYEEKNENQAGLGKAKLEENLTEFKIDVQSSFQCHPLQREQGFGKGLKFLKTSWELLIQPGPGLLQPSAPRVP